MGAEVAPGLREAREEDGQLPELAALLGAERASELRGEDGSPFVAEGNLLRRGWRWRREVFVSSRLERSESALLSAKVRALLLDPGERGGDGVLAIRLQRARAGGGPAAARERKRGRVNVMALDRGLDAIIGVGARGDDLAGDVVAAPALAGWRVERGDPRRERLPCGRGAHRVILVGFLLGAHGGRMGRVEFVAPASAGSDSG